MIYKVIPLFQSIESEGPYKVRLKYNDLYFDNEVTLNGKFDRISLYFNPM